MLKRIPNGSPPADAVLSRALEPPTRGVHIGPGAHVVIPANWLALCMANADVPGCNNATVDGGGAMYVSERVQSQVAIDAIADAAAAANGLNHGNVVAFRARIAAGDDAG